MIQYVSGSQGQNMAKKCSISDLYVVTRQLGYVKMEWREG